MEAMGKGLSLNSDAEFLKNISEWVKETVKISVDIGRNWTKSLQITQEFTDKFLVVIQTIQQSNFQM